MVYIKIDGYRATPRVSPHKHHSYPTQNTINVLPIQAHKNFSNIVLQASHHTHNSVRVQASELSLHNSPDLLYYVCKLSCTIALMSQTRGCSCQPGLTSTAISAVAAIAANALEAKKHPEHIGEVRQAVARHASAGEAAAREACLVECKGGMQ